MCVDVQSIGVCEAGLAAKGRRRQSAGLHLISSSSKTPTLPPHFLLPPASLQPQLSPNKPSGGIIMRKKREKGLASRFLKSLDGSLFCWIQVTDRIWWWLLRFDLSPCLCVLTPGYPHWRHAGLCLGMRLWIQRGCFSKEDSPACWFYYHVYAWLFNQFSLWLFALWTLTSQLSKQTKTTWEKLFCEYQWMRSILVIVYELECRIRSTYAVCSLK